MALLRARAVGLLLLSLYGFSTFAASLQSGVSNISSSDAFGFLMLKNLSKDNEYGDCFNPTTPRRGLYPAIEQDCLNAAKGVFDIRDPFRPTTFARRGNVGFKLPRVVRNATCVISIDLINGGDKDHFKPWLVYTTAVDIAHRCTRSPFRFGGRTTTGPKKVVDVLVFGRIWPLDEGVAKPTAFESAVIAAKDQPASGKSSLLNKAPQTKDSQNVTSLTLIGRSVANTTSLDQTLRLNAPELGGPLECYDPPLPRERAWPINFEDCRVATAAIFKDRDQTQRYTFSREPVATKLYYPLPAKFMYRSCVVLLDMGSNSDQDTVRLSIVEATAFVLAHKCSGEERSVDQFGGRTTVGSYFPRPLKLCSSLAGASLTWRNSTGVGAQNLINVWVYGRPWPPPSGAMNAEKLALTQPAP